MTTLWTLLAKDSIRDALHRYCRGIDRMDRELLVSVWHPGGTATYVDLFEGTGEGFADWLFKRHTDQPVRCSHQLTTSLIEVSGTRAVSEAYGTVVVQVTQADGQVAELVARGRYLDRWSNHDGRWAIDHRDFVTDAVTRTVLPSDAVDTGGGGALRSALDPSYELFAEFREDVARAD